MKIIADFIRLIPFLTILSCNNSSPRTEHNPPKEPCDELSLSRLPIVTHGFDYSDIDTVIVKTYRRGTDFKFLIKEYLLLENDDISDSVRKHRSIDLPDEITSKFDFVIIISDSLKYGISNIKVGWVDVDMGFECTMISYTINGIVDSSGSNIFFKKPGFNYPE